ncbi:hypothetical protein [Oricola sp.]|uniref:hypothetical protein n=1 Tax=Oricola sp. TaxID=1979950 RepID=UPI003BAC40DB
MTADTKTGNSTHDFDDEVLDALTDEERAEFASEPDDEATDAENNTDIADDASADVDDATEQTAKGDQTGEDDTKGDDRDADKDGSDGKDDHTAADHREGDVEDKDATQEDRTQDDKPAPPVVDFKAPEDAQSQLEALETQRKELRQKFEDGELTETEYFDQLDPIDDQRNDLRVEIKLAAKSDEMRQAQKAADEETWAGETVPAFFKEHDMYANNGILYDALDREVRRLQTAAIEKGESQHNPEFLRQAHKQVMEAFGRSAKSDKKDDVKDADTPKIPPNLGSLPASGIEDTSAGGKFDQLDRLTGEAHEAAVAALSDADREEYLSS